MSGRKSKKKKKPADPNWWKRLPTQGEFGKFERAQREQFTPMIRELASQARSFVPSKTASVLELDRLMGAERSPEDISAAFSTRLGNLAQYMQGIDMSRGASGAADVVSAAAGALGVGDVGADVAQQVGTVSGVGEYGGDVISKALMGGAAGRFAGLEADTLKERSNRMMQMGLSRAEALDSARRERRDIRTRLAETRGARRGAAVNPLDRSMGFLQLAAGLRDFDQSGMGGGGYGRGYGSVGSEEGDETTTRTVMSPAAGRQIARDYDSDLRGGPISPLAYVSPTGTGGHNVAAGARKYSRKNRRRR